MLDERELSLNILIFIKFSLFILLIFFACIYIVPLCILPRFHSPTNLMIVHVCLTIIGSALFWIIVYMLGINDDLGADIITQKRCSVISSIETLLNCLVIYSLCAISINRFCNIIYANRILFKSRRWAFICIGLTWFITLCVSLLMLILPNTKTCFQVFGQTYILQIYIILIVVIIPTVFFVIINILILKYTHQSSRRVQENMLRRRIILNNRDIRILKHMMIMFVIFLVGWSPIYVLVCIDLNGTVPSIVYRSFSILPALSLLGDITDLFLFNHQLRSYFRQIFTFRNNRIQPIVTRS